MRPESRTSSDVPVTILMATFNGADTLPEQLSSFQAQTHSNWTLHVSDDGSTDATQQRLETFAAQTQPQRVTLNAGPKRGAAANFLSLLRTQPLSAPQDAPFIAFSDQDDIWDPDRLSAGLTALSNVPADVPALFCSRTLILDASGRTRLSAPRHRAPSFRNALVQNIAAGNTILLNPAAAHLVCTAARRVNAVVVHDWWVYQMVSGAGGQVIHSDQPTVTYRQHANNVIGANDTPRAKLWRLWRLIAGDFKTWNTINIAALCAVSDTLSPENKALLSGLSDLRHKGLFTRIRQLHSLQLYRQTRASTAMLYIAAAINRL